MTILLTLTIMDNFLVQILETAMTTAEEGTNPWGMRHLMSRAEILSAEM